MQPKFILIIDTNSYSGNFERELCAYITGNVSPGDCGKLESIDFANDHHISYLNRIEINDITCEYITPNNDPELCDIYVTPHRHNTGLGICKNGSPTKYPFKPITWPAFESVAIFLTAYPTPSLLQIFTKRSHEFVAQPNYKHITINRITVQKLCQGTENKLGCNM